MRNAPVIPTPPRASRLGCVLLMAASAAHAQQPTDAGATPATDCNGSATFLVVGLAPTAKGEVDLRQGKPPGSARLGHAKFEGDNLVTFDGLCAGEHYFFAYRVRGEKDYSLSNPMSARTSGQKVSQIGSRVQMFTTPAGLGMAGPKKKASDL